MAVRSTLATTQATSPFSGRSTHAICLPARSTKSCSLSKFKRTFVDIWLASVSRSSGVRRSSCDCARAEATQSKYRLLKIARAHSIIKMTRSPTADAVCIKQWRSRTEPSTLERSTRLTRRRTVRGSRCGLMAQCTRAGGVMIRPMGRGVLSTEMAMCMKEIGLMIRHMAMEYTLTQTGHSTEESGRMTSRRDMGSRHGQTRPATRGTTLKGRSKGTASLHGLMGLISRGSSRTTTSMERVGVCEGRGV